MNLPSIRLPSRYRTAVRKYSAGITLARLRVGSGVVLFTYVCLHLSNHALGLVSDEAMRAFARFMSGLVRNWPVTIILYSAIATHLLLSLWRVYQRRSMRMMPKEWLQLAMGLAIPYFMISHVMSTRYASAVYDINDSYTYVLLSVFVFSPSYAWYNALGLVVAWLHGCIGMHMWLLTKSFYSAQIRPALLFAATLLPTLALTGYLTAGQRMIPRASNGEFMERYYQNLNLTSDAIWQWLARDTDWAEAIFASLVILVIAGRFVRKFAEGRSNRVTVEYVDGPKVNLPAGPSLLEISKLKGVPHANVCGGRGRCSTCRVRILDSSGTVNEPQEAELKALKRLQASGDVRLACQTYPQGSMKVLRLLPSDTDRAIASDYEPWSSGREKTVTMMFADIRDFTRISESRLPFDVVYLINQFSKSMGQAVERHNGRIDKFLGDGFMAIFGVDAAENSARDAIMAAGDMTNELERLNSSLAGDLDEPLRIGIGIHTGSVILGNMGYGHARGLTALGDTVNTASRLEAATKEQKCVLCISANSMRLAKFAAPTESNKRIVVRGKKAKLDIHALQDITHLKQLNEGEKE